MSGPDLSLPSDEQLIELLTTLGDGLTRPVVNEFLARGARMIPPLTSILEKEENWTEEGSWRQTHATYILGALGGPSAVPGLLAALRFSQGDFTFDELNDDLTVIFGSIGPPAIAPLLDRSRQVAPDSEERRDIFLALGAIGKGHAEGREQILAALREVCANDREPLLSRAVAGSELLDFARPEDRELLLRLARLQKKRPNDAIFLEDTVRECYEKGPDLRTPPALEWLSYLDAPREVPGEMPEAFDDDSFLEDFDPDAPLLPTPARPGRNDPCPCGSGKKYKKCCER